MLIFLLSPRFSSSPSVHERSPKSKYFMVYSLRFGTGKRHEYSSCPLEFVTFTCDFVPVRFIFFSIFAVVSVLGHDLIFSGFGSIPGDDFFGIGLYQVEFHLTKVWEQFLLI